MKKIVALVPSFAAVLAASAASSTAPQNIRQDVSRLVLLPGPYLNSPAKGAPQPTSVNLMTEGMIKMSAETTLRFEPATLTSERSLKLGSGAGTKKEFAPAPKPTAPKDPEELRFGEKLPATTQPSLLKEKKKPQPAPDANSPLSSPPPPK